jgi:hypothetical protein
MLAEYCKSFYTRVCLWWTPVCLCFAQEDNESYVSLLEEGLEAALKATTALYDQTVDSLTQLTAQDISNIFQGAKICDLLLQPGTTTLDLSLQAGCFTNESKYGTLLHYRRDIFLWTIPWPWPLLWSTGQSSLLQIQKSGFDSRRYQIFWEVVDLERGPLSLVSTIEELLGRESSSSGLESEDTAMGIHCTDHANLQELALTSLTSSSRSFSIVRAVSGHGVFLWLFQRLDCIALNGRMTDFFFLIPFYLQAVQIHSANGVKLLEAWRGELQDLEGRSCGPIVVLWYSFMEGLKKTKSLGIDGVLADIRTMNLNNTSLEHYCYTSLQVSWKCVHTMKLCNWGGGRAISIRVCLL